jgi:hypothetical protein
MFRVQGLGFRVQGLGLKYVKALHLSIDPVHRRIASRDFLDVALLQAE